MSYQIEIIPNESYVYRQTIPRERTGPKKRKFPNESHFQLRPNEAGLSVNWDKYIDVENNFLLISLTKSHAGNLLDYTMFKIFKYPVKFLRSVSKIEDVKHKPLCYGNPSPFGLPNNKAHSEVCYENDIEICVKLSDYCNTCFDESYCEFDVSSIDDKVLKLRDMLNDTPFHKL